MKDYLKEQIRQYCAKVDAGLAVCLDDIIVHEQNGAWWFWYENWTDRSGPYTNKADAVTALNKYSAAKRVFEYVDGQWWYRASNGAFVGPYSSMLKVATAYDVYRKELVAAMNTKNETVCLACGRVVGADGVCNRDRGLIALSTAPARFENEAGCRAQEGMCTRHHDRAVGPDGMCDRGRNPRTIDEEHARAWHAAQVEKSSKKSRSILQDWVQELGMRHQGVLVSSVRGCDTAPKEAGSKALTRYFRSAVLNAHCGDPTKAKSFIEVPDYDMFKAAEERFFAEWDSMPLHFAMHFVHAAEIVGYYHPDQCNGKGSVAALWYNFYLRACKKLHVNSETKAQLDMRLNADEESFGAQQKE